LGQPGLLASFTNVPPDQTQDFPVAHSCTLSMRVNVIDIAYPLV
jgi:hypothetical protein